MARVPYLSIGIPGPASSVNILRTLAKAPTLLPLLAQQGRVNYTLLALTTRLRELVILYSSFRFESAYEHQHHVTGSQRAGIGKTAGDSTYFLQGKPEPRVFSQQKLAMSKLLEATINSPTVDDDVFREAKQYLSDKQMVEVVLWQGYYYEVGRITTVFQIDMDELPPQVASLHEEVDDE